MRILSYFLSVALCFTSAEAADGFLLGIQGGQVAGPTLSNGTSYTGGLGYGLTAGMVVNPVLNVALSVDHSNHSLIASLDLTSASVSADYHFLQVNDFDFSIGAGPGFYFFTVAPLSQNNFGLHGSAAIDVLLSNRFRLGVVGKYHYVFSSTIGGPYWTALMRFTYVTGSL